MNKKKLAVNGDCKGEFIEWNKVFNDDGGSSREDDCLFLFEKQSGSDNTEHAILSSQHKSFDNFRKWLRNGRNEELIHLAGSTMAANIGCGFSEGGSMYEVVIVENRDFRENTAIRFAELVKRGIDVNTLISSKICITLSDKRTINGIFQAFDKFMDLVMVENGDFCANTAIRFAELE